MVIIGIGVGGLTMAFHITCYILDAHRFSFLGNEKNPFTKFCINNSLIPLAFLITYLIRFIRFQFENEFANAITIIWQAAGLITGFSLITMLLSLYFTGTNKDIFKVLANSMNAPFRRRHRITRVNVMRKVDKIRQSRIRIDYFLDHLLRVRKANDQLMDLGAALQVLRQNHQNAFIIQCFVFLTVIGLGIFREKPGFQIPAGASILLLFTLLILFAGAISFWLRGWAVTALAGAVLLLNLLVEQKWIQSNYAAFGLDYSTQSATYNIETLTQLSHPRLVRADIDSTKEIMGKWRTKFPSSVKPKIIFLCASGGGQRAALWTMRAMQVTDSLLKGRMMQHTFLMTGASGGLIGASYYRELYLRQQTDPSIQLYHRQYLNNIAKDNLNAIAFTLVVSDLLFKFQTFEYAGNRYFKDRGYAFEQQINKNTGNLLDKPVIAYREPEKQARIPMLILSPTVINDGRKLYISPLAVSYLNAALPDSTGMSVPKIKGVEFRRFFRNQDADSLRFLSALRMNATFPYITPNVSLPSQPAMEIMDAGLADNYGVSDAVRFMYVFRKWIDQHTSGVIFLSIRDSPKEPYIEANKTQSLFDKIVTPVGSLYNNWSHWQDIQNDNSLQYARQWLNVPVLRADLVYSAQQSAPADNMVTSPNGRKSERASLSWRLTEREKASIRRAIFDQGNQETIRQLQHWLE